jgi:hypothetical protein
MLYYLCVNEKRWETGCIDESYPNVFEEFTTYAKETIGESVHCIFSKERDFRKESKEYDGRKDEYAIKVLDEFRTGQIGGVLH